MVIEKSVPAQVHAEIEDFTQGIHLQRQPNVLFPQRGKFPISVHIEFRKPEQIGGQHPHHPIGLQEPVALPEETVGQIQLQLVDEIFRMDIVGATVLERQGLTEVCYHCRAMVRIQVHVDPTVELEIPGPKIDLYHTFSFSGQSTSIQWLLSRCCRCLCRRQRL